VRCWTAWNYEKFNNIYVRKLTVTVFVVKDNSSAYQLKRRKKMGQEQNNRSRTAEDEMMDLYDQFATEWALEQEAKSKKG
jgi:hypothetical protein